MPWVWQASAISRTTSPCPLRHGLRFTECSVYFDGHRQKPSWCLQVRIRPVMLASASDAHDLFGVEIRGREDAGGLVAVPPFLVGEGVGGEVEEAVELAAVPT
ncbi:MAG: hypothetical protein R2856_24110 [Caldilineaceae bacterium]